MPFGDGREAFVQSRPVEPFTPHHHTEGLAGRRHIVEWVVLQKYQVRCESDADAAEFVTGLEELGWRDRAGSQRLVGRQPRSDDATELVMDREAGDVEHLRRIGPE